MAKYRRSVVFLLRLFYMAALFVIFNFMWRGGYPETVYFDAGNYVVMFAYALLLFIFMTVYGAFQVGVQRLSMLIYSSGLALVVTNFILYLVLCMIARAMLVPWPLLAQTGLQLLAALLGCYVINRAYYAMHPVREVIAVIGDDPDDQATLQKMRMIHERFKIAGAVDAALPLGDIKRLIEPYGSVLIGTVAPDVRQALLHHCYRAGKRINIIPSVTDIAMNASHQTQIFDTLVLLCRNAELSTEQKLIKRMLDILFSAVMLLLSSPFMLICALAIKCGDGGPVFFRQKRLTADGKTFRLIKFRSMIVDAEKKNGAQMTTEGDSRITKVGRVLRALRMDELPQLFNIFWGSMSIVGPRPERPEYYKLYTQSLPDFNLRLKVKAGLTGYAQIYGRYNTTPRDKLNMDLLYIENFSLLQDIKLMVLTLKILFVRESTEGFSEQSVYYIAKKDAADAERADTSM